MCIRDSLYIASDEEINARVIQTYGLIKETMNIASAISGMLWILSSWERSITETKFIWIPGDRPVNVPEITPSSNAMVISRIILSLPKV